MNAEQLIPALLAQTPGWDAQAARAGLDADDVAGILSEAARVTREVLAPAAATADAVHAQLVDGRVKMPEGSGEAYRFMGENGWLTTDLPEEFGGQGLPTALHIAASLFFEGEATPLMMAGASARAGMHLLAAVAPDMAAEWGPKIAAAEWAMTICISEPDAGSDVGRIRTRAEADGDAWRLYGKKCWISSGDHDMTARIGHLCLARTGAPEEGTRGLSLFLVANTTDDGADNHIVLERIEEKLGLHGSPTCVLNFEGAQARMIGKPGRGLAVMFHMIEVMRLQSGAHGVAMALASAELATRYAAERTQGGRPDQPAVAIDTHPDVKRMLAQLDADAALATAMLFECAVALDESRAGDASAAARAAFLLPLAKTFGGEAGFDCASQALQVFGGAGYTREWPVERHLRDSRIITIFEGATGMQGQDFLMRRLLKDEGAGLKAVVARFAEERAAHPDPLNAEAERILRRFLGLAEGLTAEGVSTPARLLAADGCLRAGWAMMRAQLALRLARVGDRERRLARFALHFADAEMARAEAACALDPDML
ncbi:acyl-CoA dehydrogenase family protein [Rhodovulum sp. DZ06]|uniref:acyl-CoA dehydrogenase family protein n=1 Tax=Rhodovulum sp. DZ06 TaxID=3425126 RepID=UPI003D340C3A